jgi:uncharacterized protein (DUF1684 family)
MTVSRLFTVRGKPLPNGIELPLWFMALLAALLFGCAPSPETMPSPTAGNANHEQEILAYRQAREEGLRSPDGWLSLVGLFWLQEGHNTLGGDPNNRVALPVGQAPGVVGGLDVKGGQVSIKVEPGVAVTANGQLITSLDLKSDAEGEPTILKLGSLEFYVIDRAGRLGIRVKDSASEVLKNFTGLDYYPINLAWRLDARYERYDSPREVDIPNIIGTTFREPSPGALLVEIGGKTYDLIVFPDAPSYLLAFGDTTNGSETYGGGRFLKIELPPESGTVVLDFNKAYSPPCVFTPYATCPLPPPQNKIAVPVQVGEKGYVGVGH